MTDRILTLQPMNKQINTVSIENIPEFHLIQQAAPHIAEKMELFWGSGYFAEYVNKLILNSDDGSLTDIDLSVYMAFHDLLKQHDQLYPRSVKTNVWDSHYKW
jgi:hypothetical protein